MTRWGPVTIETVRGTPIDVYGRTLVPVGRVISAIKRRGTIRRDQVEGWAWGVAHVRPLAVIEERNGDVRVLPIPDHTASILRKMALVGLAMPALAMALVWINRWMRRL